MKHTCRMVAQPISVAPGLDSGALAQEPSLGTLPHWQLEHLYPAPDAPQVEADLAWIAQESAAFAQTYRGKLADLIAGPESGAKLGAAPASPAAQLFAAIARYEALEDRMGKLGAYAGLLYAGDTTNPAYAKFYGDISEKLTDSGTKVLFFALELNQLDDTLLARLVALKPLDHYAPWLSDLRAEKPYQLSEKLEELFAEKATTGRNAFNRLFDETMAAMRFEVAGETLALEGVLGKLQHPQSPVRKAAAGALAAGLAAKAPLFTLITNTLAKDHEISTRWRGFVDVAASRHLANRVEPEVVAALVQAVEAAHPRLTHRYYALKARWFGQDKLAFYDRNAPLPDEVQRVIPWEEAQQTVLSAYTAFSPDLAQIGARFFKEGWIDAPVRPGKSPGAFAHPTVPSAHPYLMLNYLGKPRDVMTLAHELGHGIHQVLAGHQGALMAPTPLTLAETASVFGEMLTFRALLAGAPNPQARRVLLAGKVEDMLNTVVRQIAFYRFERKVHEARRSGELTTPDLNALWLSVQGDSLGPAIDLEAPLAAEAGAGYETFWAYIPHFIHSPFYVYAYAFGDCLVNSLYGVYENAHPRFVEHYIALLSAGGAKPYGELLQPFGLDARDPAFWQIGLSMIEGMIDELEAL